MEELRCKYILSKKLLVLRLVLFLGIFCISFFTKGNISKAYTFDEFVDYCQQIKDGQITTNNVTITGCTYLLDNESRIRSATNVNNYTNFVLSYGSPYYYLSMNNGCTAQQVSTSSNNFTLQNVTTPKWGCYIVNSYSISNAGTNNDWINSFTTDIRYTVGLVNNYNTNNRGYFNQYIAKTPLEFDDNFDNIVIYNGEHARYYQR